MAPHPGPVRYPLRTLCGLGLFALLALAMIRGNFRAETLSIRGERDPNGVLMQVARFRDTGFSLPPVATAGYLSDWPYEEGRGAAAYLIAQYELAPVLIAYNTTTFEYVVGNFSPAYDYAPLAKSHNLVPVKTFSNGLVLFRRAPR